MARPVRHYTLVRGLRPALTKRTFEYRHSSHMQHATKSRQRPLTTFARPPFERIDTSMLVEEETLPGYRAERYYPVHIGETFNDRYKVLGKLGYGSASTVWLCRDLRHSDQFVALKVYINCSEVHRELPVYEHINSLRSEHKGRDRIRKLLESFEMEGPYGKHICLIHEPFGISLGEIKEYLQDGIVTASVIRVVFRWILRGLEYLHEEANVIHTDLQPNNLLISTENNDAFEEFENDEAEHPIPRKELGDRTIYMSRPVSFVSGLPAVSDLSEARFGGSTHTDDIMPDAYRAPEVILGLPWSYPVDIWGLGMVIWELFEGTRLFSAKNPEDQYSERYHLAQMVAILRPPPLDLIRQSERSERFWDKNGQWIAGVPIPDGSLETTEHRLDGKEKTLFLAFMRKMLQWKPEARGSCMDVFYDEWLLGDLIEAGVIESPAAHGGVSNGALSR